MLDHYKKLRTQLIGNIEQLEKISFGRSNTKIADNFREIRDKLIENRFHLVVLGQFKRGKSTFINSIIGDRILPTSVVPLTSIVTMLKYGEVEKIEVIFEEGGRQVISRDNLPDYVTERGNPKNMKKVKHVEIAFPSAFLKDGVFIIDT
ncbi:MAG: Dynamin family protein, partial [Deltaproteobacteria bacterium]